ncbi:homoserine O-succinyltransferase [[Clostridium] methylpentosum DSM 5476]|uniref:Homoserine O-acetyltransferase n=1 Tax=[Clostridium] methylpentosum DSM 5476 TaxID=537013 RepID=C0EBQ6_9FIRM|nr:homoserine O-succinyltransferase [[Clostridium] methylpentosum DSM 5476]MDY3989451.1 homoserine O-succinyltransferase [Massilioclostridium sp.]
MPINIPGSLPAASALENENIFIMKQDRAETQDIRPLRILLLNLMPKKSETETQILRLLSNSPLQVDIELLQTASHVSKNTPQQHMIKFYSKLDDIRSQKFDGMIVTGAPVENLEFEDVDYWDELCEIFDWAKTHVFSTLYICWGAIAGLYYHYGIKRKLQDEKIFGIFPHSVLVPRNSIVRGFDETFYVPHSRYFYLDAEEIDKCNDLTLLTTSYLSGVHMVASNSRPDFFITGHSEYDRDTLANEYQRDVDKGLDIQIPHNYFPNDDPNETPRFIWRSHANLLFSNWLNYVVYQNTPYDIDQIGR